MLINFPRRENKDFFAVREHRKAFRTLRGMAIAALLVSAVWLVLAVIVKSCTT